MVIRTIRVVSGQTAVQQQGLRCMFLLHHEPECCD